MKNCVFVVGFLLLTFTSATGAEDAQKIVRIGGVAYKPEKVTIFKNLKILQIFMIKHI